MSGTRFGCVKIALISLSLSLHAALEKVEALADNPIGDDYYINSMEEFYCDVEKGALKMSKQTTKPPPTQFSRLGNSRKVPFFLLATSH